MIWAPVSVSVMEISFGWVAQPAGAKKNPAGLRRRGLGFCAASAYPIRDGACLTTPTTTTRTTTGSTASAENWQAVRFAFMRILVVDFRRGQTIA